jgi:hypothetical protein
MRIPALLKASLFHKNFLTEIEQLAVESRHLCSYKQSRRLVSSRQIAHIAAVRCCLQFVLENAEDPASMAVLTALPG